MREQCSNKRDLAIIDFLASTGIRVGEMVKLNKDDIKFDDKSCIVFGKGAKERKVYFNGKAKVHLQEYIESRNDNNEALFVSLKRPYNRLGIRGVEILIKSLGDKINIKAHPHKFRRTLATKAIDKGMPIEQVQRLLGHSKLDTTLIYAMVNQTNVKIYHSKYIC